MTRDLTFTVPEEHAGQRLDKLVGARAQLGRRRTAELFARGNVTMGGRRVAKGDPAQSGELVTVTLDTDDRPPPEPDSPLVVRLETRQLVIAVKPAGQASAPLRGEAGTLAGALLGRYPEMAGVGHSPREPGLLHRLDTQTSGLVLAVRTPDAFERLHRALRQGQLTKRYLAIVEDRGVMDSGVIDSPIASDRKNPRRVLVGAAAAQKGRTATQTYRALTRYRLVRRAGGWALLEVEVSRAYRHQVRAHLASVGHPIAGDAVYGGPAAPDLGERHALHASYVAWAGDEIIEGFAVQEPLPEELASLIGG